MPKPRPHARPWRRSLRSRSALILASIAATAVSGCAQTVTGTTAQMCQDWQQIGVSKKDVLTDQTATEIVGNNRARKVWCSAAHGKA